MSFDKCKCVSCPTPPKPDHAFCSWCSATLFAEGEECHGNFVCFENPCSGSMLIRSDYAVTHYHEITHRDRYEDDEKALRKAGLHDHQVRRHPKAVSPADSFDSQ